jgi:Uma2 family endonuclease
MNLLITDPGLADRVLQQRREAGADRFDEVWEGTYVMAPMPNDEHQQIVGRFSGILLEVVEWPGLGDVRPGTNLSPHAENWEHDYRCPDVAVFLREGRAENLGTHWRGPADLLVEVISPYDRTREKLPFYQWLGVREVLLVDRAPWRLELYRREAGRLGQSEPGSGNVLAGVAVALTFELMAGEPRPRIRVVHAASDREWLV